jgi:hypothetical protein
MRAYQFDEELLERVHARRRTRDAGDGGLRLNAPLRREMLITSCLLFVRPALEITTRYSQAELSNLLAAAERSATQKSPAKLRSRHGDAAKSTVEC